MLAHIVRLISVLTIDVRRDQIFLRPPKGLKLNRPLIIGQRIARVNKWRSIAIVNPRRKLIFSGDNAEAIRGNIFGKCIVWEKQIPAWCFVIGSDSAGLFRRLALIHSKRDGRFWQQRRGILIIQVLVGLSRSRTFFTSAHRLAQIRAQDLIHLAV